MVTDRIEDGRQIRLLAVIDEYPRECLAIEAASSITARDVILTLKHLFAAGGSPRYIRSDIGPELVVKELQHCLALASVQPTVN